MKFIGVATVFVVTILFTALFYFAHSWVIAGALNNSILPHFQGENFKRWSTTDVWAILYPASCLFAAITINLKRKSDDIDDLGHSVIFTLFCNAVAFLSLAIAYIVIGIFL